jgi:hypothetical protein
MGQKFLSILFCVCTMSATAGDLFGGGVGADGGLSSDGGYGAGAGSGGGFGSGTDGGSGSQTVFGKLQSQGLNFYVGGGLGLGMFNATMTATEGYPSGAPAPVGHKAKIKSKLPGIALQFGAQKKGQMLTDFGVMLMYAPTTTIQKTPGGGGTFTDKNTFQQKYNFSVYGGAGIPITPAVNVFGKLGLVYSSFTIGYQQVGSSYAGSETTGAMGVAPGVMLQYKMSDTFSANLDLSYAVYQSITTSNLAKSPAGYSYKIKTSPRVMTIMLGGTMTLGSGK